MLYPFSHHLISSSDVFFHFHAIGEFQNKFAVAVSEQCIFFGNYDKINNKKHGNRFLKHVSGSWEGFSTQATANIIKIPLYNPLVSMKC